MYNVNFASENKSNTHFKVMRSPSLSLDLVLKRYNFLVNIILEKIKDGKTVIIPTDTCYGFCADPTNEIAIRAIYAAKNRALNQSMGLFMADIQMAEKYCKISSQEHELLEKSIAQNKPITLICPAKAIAIKKFSEYCFSTDGVNTLIGFRIPKLELIRDVITNLGHPLVQTSVNIAGSKPLYSANVILEKFSLEYDFFLDAGILDKNPPSTIIKSEKGKIKVLRGSLE